MLKRTFLSLLFLVAFAGVAEAQIASEIANGGGTAGAITAGVGSGNAGRVPQFASTTSVVDSKMLTSGTNSGTWTLYDSTAGSGNTSLVIRHGDTQTANPFEIRNAAGALTSYFEYAFNVLHVGQLAITGDSGTITTAAGADIRANFFGDFTISNPTLLWPDVTTPNVGLKYSAAGILKVTDGSTGSGGIGISDTATATVTDALILRHATTDAGFGQDGFGTGLLFQGEDEAGNMQSMAQIQAVYTDSANGSEDSNIVLRNIVAGTVTDLATLTSVGSLASAPQLTVAGGFSIVTDYTFNLVSSGSSLDLRAAGPLNLYSASVARWRVDTDFLPLATNSYNLGSTTAFVKDSYLGTSIQGTRSKVLTEGAATGFVDIAVASGEGTGGYVEYTVETTDGTDRTIETGMLYFSGVNLNGGTVDDSDVGLVGTPVQSTSAANVFVNTFSVTSGTDKITVNCSSATTLAGTDVITIRYRVVVNRGTATVTPIA